MQKVTIDLPEDLKRSLKAIALQRGVSLSAVAREALQEYFEGSPSARWPRSVGMVSDGSFDPAKDEQYLKDHWKPDW
jgi:hypothetical protein